MALVQSKYASGNKRSSTPEIAGVEVNDQYEITLTATQGAAANVVEFGPLPANMTITDAKLITDKLDAHATPTHNVDIGVMTGKAGELLDDAGDARTVGVELFDGVTYAQAGGFARTVEPDAFKIAPVAYDRGIGMLINTAATATAGTIRLNLTFASKQ